MVLGFKLTSLSKLTSVKTGSGDTMLQYLVSRLHEQVPECLQLCADMPSLQEARLVIFPRLAADLRKMDEGVVLLQSFQTGLDMETDSLVLNRLQEHLDETQRASARASAKLSEAVGDFQDLVQYFGEDPKMQPEELFGPLQAFVKNVESAAAVAEAKVKKAARVDLFKRI